MFTCSKCICLHVVNVLCLHALHVLCLHVVHVLCLHVVHVLCLHVVHVLCLSQYMYCIHVYVMSSYDIQHNIPLLLSNEECK